MPVKITVIGLGHMGRIHLDKLCAFDGATVTGIFDIDRERSDEYAKKYSLPVFPDHRSAIGSSTAAVIATPTEDHYAIASECLDRGVHVFLEKPITARPEEARQLVEAASAKGLVLQVGHLERLNPAFAHVAPSVRQPLLIECRRISPFTGRSTDVDVVLDLMIHDIDLVLSLAGDEVQNLFARGLSFMTDKIDVAYAWIEFAGGCVATLMASRVASFRERSLAIHEKDRILAIDLMKGSLVSTVRDAAGAAETSEYTAGQMDPVKDELLQFIGAIEGHGPPSVTGADGLKALLLANRVRQCIFDSQDERH